MNTPLKKVVIFGFGVAGKDVLRAIQRTRKPTIEVVGFLDDDKNKLSQSFHGVKVLGGRELIPLLSRKKKIEEVIIAMPSAFGESISDLIKTCTASGIKSKIVPRVREIIEGRVHMQTIRDVKVEDLLGRPIVKSDVKQLKNFFDKKKVLITGAAGSIGSELTRQICAYRPSQVLVFDWWENGVFNLHQELSKAFPRVRVKYIIGNIQDKKKVSSILKDYKPNFVFHAAAYKHVPIMEENIEEAVKNNVLGTYNLAHLAKKYGVERFVLISTDKAANPKSIMGTTKFLAEQILQNMRGNTKYITVRFGNVLDSNGSVIPTFRRQIKNGGPVTVTDKRMTRYFMTIPEASHLILNAASIGKGREIFLLDMGDPVKINDLAKNLIRLSGYSIKEIGIIYTGIRKGEKLHERLFSDNEKLQSSEKEKIFNVKKSKENAYNINYISSIIRFAQKENNLSLRKELQKIIIKS